MTTGVRTRTAAAGVEHRAENYVENRALSVADAARYCGIATGTMRNRISLGVGPRVSRIGRRVIIRLHDLEAWVSSTPASVPRR